MRQGEYIPSFDGVRGVAVIPVILIHGSYGVTQGGWIGVDLFFVLSGHLITSLLLEEFRRTGRIDFRKFYARRVLRLGPALLAGVVLANGLWKWCGLEAGASRSWANLGSLFYFANLVSPRLLGPLTHMWSLSVEEHFYFFWPVLAGAVLFRLGPAEVNRGAGAAHRTFGWGARCGVWAGPAGCVRPRLAGAESLPLHLLSDRSDPDGLSPRGDD